MEYFGKEQKNCHLKEVSKLQSEVHIWAKMLGTYVILIIEVVFKNKNEVILFFFLNKK